MSESTQETAVTKEGGIIDTVTDNSKMINRVFNEDCLVAMQRIESNSINLVLCDLPYQ